MELFGYFASILMGLSLGLVGGGGSILTVPILVYLFQVNPTLATAYSLFIVGLTSLIGGFQAYLNKQVDFKRGILFAVPSFIGVYGVRSQIMPLIPDTVFEISSYIMTKSILIMMVFAVLMLLASFSMIKSSLAINDTQNKKKKVNYFLIALEGLIVGGVTGFVGAGGGFLIIPALVLLTGLPMKIAVGTSLFIISIKSLFGFLGDVQTQAPLDWYFMFTLVGISILGLFLGVQLKSKVSDHLLKKGFGWFVLIMGFLILSDQIIKVLGNS